MKRFVLYILFVSLCQTISSQNNDFWTGDYINSSESTNFRVKVNRTLYNINDTTWVKDIDIPIGLYTAIDIDKNNNIWLFGSSKIDLYLRSSSVWSSINNPPISIMFGKVFNNYVYCGNSTSIYRTDYTQSSINWELLYEGDTFEDFYVHGDKIYIAKYLFEVVRSTIGSQTWESILTTPSSPAKLAVTDELISIGTYWNGVYSSSDSGRTWVNGTGLPSGRGSEEVKVINESEVYALVKDQRSTLGWYYSNDKGKTFNSLTGDFSPWERNQMRGLEIIGEEIFINAGYRGFFKSTDKGTTWIEINNGYNNNRPHHIKKIINTINDEIIVLSSIGGLPLPWYQGTWGIFKTTDNGLSWKEISYNLFPEFMIIEDIIETNSGDLVVAPYDPGYLYILRNGESEWQKINIRENMLNGTSFNGSTIEVLEKGSEETIYAASFWDGLLMSLNNGESWAKLDYGYNNRGVQFISLSENELFIISCDQIGYVGLFYSNDLGSTWEKLNDNGIHFRGVKKENDVLFAYSSTSIFKSLNMGETWQEITENLPTDISINSIDFATIDSLSKSQVEYNLNVFIGSNKGAYKKNMNNDGWERITNSEVNCIYYSETSKIIHFGSIESFFSQYLNTTYVKDMSYNSDLIPFSAYINNSSRNIIVKNLSDFDQIVTISLYNNIGRTLITKTSVEDFSSSIYELKTGIYIITVRYKSGKRFSEKIIVTN